MQLKDSILDFPSNLLSKCNCLVIEAVRMLFNNNSTNIACGLEAYSYCKTHE